MMRMGDWARGAYARLPGNTRRLVGPVAGILPSRMRYGSTFRQWEEKIARSHADPGFAAHAQHAAIVGMLDRSLRSSPFYGRRFRDTFGPDVTVERIMADWNRVPVLTNAVVGVDPGSLCTVDPGALDVTSTGGTSGKPLTFFIDRWRSPVEFAFVMSAWSRAGCTLDTWRAAFRGFAIPDFPREIADVDFGLRELKISVFHVADALIPAYVEQIRRRGITCLQGYPSALALFASGLRRRGLAPMADIRSIVMSSERVFGQYRKLLAETFPHAVVVPYYGLSEKCAFAVEVPGLADTYDFEPLYGFTEIVDGDDQPVTEPGQSGRIVTTGLLYPGMPFIRYDTGDRATLVEQPSKANAFRLRVSGIIPRNTAEFLVTADGRLVSALGVCGFHDEMARVSEYQVVQEEQGRALVRFVLAPGGSPSDVVDYLRLINAKAAGSILFDFEIVDALPRSQRGKCRFIDQRLDVAALEKRAHDAS